MESSPKLVKFVGPSSTQAEELFPSCFTWFAAAAFSVRLRIFLSGSTSVSVARRGCQASCYSLAKRWFAFFSLVSSTLRSKWFVYSSKHLSSSSENIRRISSIEGPPNSVYLGKRGHCPRVQLCSSFGAPQGKSWCQEPLFHHCSKTLSPREG